jgi:hypothetical protein
VISSTGFDVCQKSNPIRARGVLFFCDQEGCKTFAGEIAIHLLGGFLNLHLHISAHKDH